MSKRWHIVTFDGGRGMDIQDDEGEGVLTKANAPLIAAAPELMESLIRLCDASGEAAALTKAGLQIPLKVWNEVVESINESLSVIDKAKGK